MSKQAEALKMALEALGWTDEWRPQGLREEAINAIKEALAEPEQEPVGEVILYTGDGFPCAPFHQVKWRNGMMPPEGAKLYLAPQRKPLTDEEIVSAIKIHVDPVATYSKLHNFVRAIEAAHGIKEQQ